MFRDPLQMLLVLHHHYSGLRVRLDYLDLEVLLLDYVISNLGQQRLRLIHPLLFLSLFLIHLHRRHHTVRLVMVALLRRVLHRPFEHNHHPFLQVNAHICHFLLHIVVRFVVNRRGFLLRVAQQLGRRLVRQFPLVVNVLVNNNVTCGVLGRLTVEKRGFVTVVVHY